MKYIYQDYGLIFKALTTVFSDFFYFLNVLLNFPMRMKIIQSYSNDFDVPSWIIVYVLNIALIAVIVMTLNFLRKLLRKVFKFKVSVKEYDRMKNEVATLNKEVLKLNYEKDKILAMKVTEMGMKPNENILNLDGDKLGVSENEDGEKVPETTEEEEATLHSTGHRNTFEDPPVSPDTSRFFRLTTVDNYYKTEYQPPEYDNDITLEEFCDRWRLFAASRLRLYYDINIMRYLVSAMGSTRIMILQGISGTGKTSLPYSFGKYVQLDSTISAVQPAWRDRTELFGYYNEFTKVFNETDFLRAVYEANYYKEPHIIVLDEMNIARVEYYFAEMLSVLEMPRSEEWLVDICNTTWDNDPCGLVGGKVHVNENTWFIGTINNDDSTFAVADKVYDRAIPIDLDSKAAAFEAPDTPPVHVTAEHLIKLFKEAKEKYPLSEDSVKKMNDLDAYLIKHFRLSFGNRIIKQMRDFIPCFVACGGTEIDAIDFIIAKKILRKFESLSLSGAKDEYAKFISYLDKTFGKQNMGICKEYITRLSK